MAIKMSRWAVLAALPVSLAFGGGFGIRHEGRDLVLLDGEEVLAKVVLRADGSPWLTDVRLAPGAPAAIGRMSLFWWQYVNNEGPGRSVSRIRDLQAKAFPDRLEVRVKTANDGGTVLSEYTATLHRDPSGNAYRIDFATTLSIAPGSGWLVEPQSGVEFTDIYWPVERAVQGKDWQNVLYRDGGSVVRRVPLNHADSADKFNIYFHYRDGFVGLAGGTPVNPVFELAPETARETFAELCAYSYDLHLIRRVNPNRRLHRLVPPDAHFGQNDRHTLPGGSRLEARFRLRLQSRAEVDERSRSARLLEIPRDWWQLWEVPVYEPLNRFQDALNPAVPDRRWYWETALPQQAGWDRSVGYGDRASLRVTGDSGPAWWETKLGREFFGEPFRPGQAYRVTARVLTRKGDAARARLLFQYGAGKEAPQWSSQPVAGAGEWRMVTLDIPPQPAGSPWLSRGSLKLVVEGRGTAWFDDVEIRNAPVR